MNDNIEQEILLEPDPARVMEGLRDTGYDFNTAMADLVDNSIAADATVVKVTITMNPFGELNVFIADNGCGMDMKGLKNAMKYGSARREDPSSLGKFGLGLKTASTAFCRCLSLLSKGQDDTYRKVQWDLDEICTINKWRLGQPELNQDEIDLLESVTNGGRGTLVIWEKVDRLMKSYVIEKARTKAFNKMILELKKHFAMVYQRFLDSSYTDARNIDIYINDEKVEAWDPFCKNEPNSNLLAKENMQVELPDGTITSFTVEAWLLPRKEEFSSPDGNSKARISNDMEGFYVYRENRLIHYGDWLGMFVSDPHLSLLRINFSFDHTLDDAFNVDIKKSRILLNEDIYEHLKEEFLPAPRREASELYRKGQVKKIKDNGNAAHDASNANINQKASSVEGSKIEVVDPNKGTVNISNPQGTFTGVIRIKHMEKPGQCRVVPTETIESGMLWEPIIVDGNHGVAINQSHSYYTKVYAPVLNNPVMVQGMDALLWALAEAELSTYNDETKEQYEDMRIQVSRILKKLVADLPDPKLDESEEV